MRIVVFAALALLGVCSVSDPVQAQQSCSAQCRDSLNACSKNYSGKACKTEYDICVKGCQKK